MSVDPFATADRPRVSDEDAGLFQKGAHTRLYQVLGARPLAGEEAGGVRFGVWAPTAAAVSVIGDFNGWRHEADPLRPRYGGSGIWEGEVAGASPGALYKYRVEPASGGPAGDHADPFARAWELPPGTASRLWRRSHDWEDGCWMGARTETVRADAPVAIYEVHLASWRRVVLPQTGERFLDYREAAERLPDHLSDLGFTHVELLPIMEHRDPSLIGYRTLGLFAPAAQQGSPDALMALIDRLHQRGIGVILDWSRAATSPAAMALTALDAGGGEAWQQRAAQGLAPPAGLERPEVRAFCLSAALYWLDRYHIDGLRLAGRDARGKGGGEEETGAEALVRQLSAAIRDAYPGVLCITSADAEPSGTELQREGGECGAWLHWDRSLVKEVRAALEREPARQRAVRLPLAAGPASALLALSHEEADAREASLLGRMPGDDWQRRARLRLLLGWLWALPGKKLLFMGGEFGQWQPWSPAYSLDWHLLEQAGHRGLQTWVRDLNQLYRRAPALGRAAERGEAPAMAVAGAADGVTAMLRPGGEPADTLLVVANTNPEPIGNCRVGVPRGGWWREVLNSDAWMYGGSGRGSLGGADADPVPLGEQFLSLLLSLPPLGVVFLQYHGHTMRGERA